MAADMFLKLDDIKGESQDGKHKDEMDVLAWSWGASQSGTMHTGGGGGAGKASVNDLSLTKYVDKASPNLLGACCSGKHFDQATLVVRKAGDKPLEYLKYTFKQVLVSSINVGGSGGEDRLTENVTLNFAEYKMEYFPQKSDGSGDAAVEVAWHIGKNQKA
ncbi:Hcp family type VI secretion system effector [Pseudoduganella sp. OTU4001]|uniref:Hcp family type VI secretion system effector n=1 Tax=Pseudoduganella sp. OTU4001 TaxID=3043854 RepID=UPI00313DB9D0